MEQPEDSRSQAAHNESITLAQLEALRQRLARLEARVTGACGQSRAWKLFRPVRAGNFALLALAVPLAGVVIAHPPRSFATCLPSSDSLAMTRHRRPVLSLSALSQHGENSALPSERWRRKWVSIPARCRIGRPGNINLPERAWR